MPKDVYLTPMSEWIRQTSTKPNVEYKDRIKSAQRINAIAQIFNLLSQGVGASQGARVNPMVDQVTPFALNEFGRMRQEELVQGEKERQYGLQALSKQIDYDIDEGRRTEDKEFKKQEDAKYRATPEQQLEISIARGAAERLNKEDLMKLQHEQKMQQIDASNKAAIQKIYAKEKAKSEEGGKDKYIKSFKDQDGTVVNLTQNDITNLFTSLYNNQEAYKEVAKNHPGAILPFGFAGESVSKDFQAAMVEKYWPYIRDTYKDVKGVKGASNQSQGQKPDNEAKFQSAVNEWNVIDGQNYSPEVKKKAFWEIFKAAGLDENQINRLWNSE